jgi:uncharacterized beta-barrel protein YwiB (DUF1934 family)
MKHAQDFLITIVGKQTVDGSTDTVEVVTEGTMIPKDNHYLILYREYNNESAHLYSDNAIRVEPDTVVIRRTGVTSSELYLEREKRHQCLYETEAGCLSIGIYTKSVKSDLTPDGGTLEVSYTIDFSADLISENRFSLKLERKKNQNASDKQAKKEER